MAVVADRVIVELEAKLDRYEANVRRAEAKFAAATANIDQNSKRMAREIERNSNAAGQSLRNLASAFAAGFSAAQVAKLADSYTRFTNSLKVAGLEGQNLAGAQEKLFSVAQRNGVALEAVGTLYSRAAQNQKELGASTADLIGLTRAVAASLKISGTSTAEASGALLQLGQALGSPRIQAEEFNSLLDTMQPLLREASKYIDGTGNSLSGLTRKIKDTSGPGVSNVELFRAITQAMAALEGQADKTALTINGAFTNLSNALTKYIGEADQANGASAAVVAGLNALANNLDVVTDALGVLAAVMAGRFVAGMVAASASTGVVSTAIFAMQARAAGAATTMEALALAGTTAGRSLLAAFGGPVGAAVAALTIGIGYLVVKDQEAAQAAQELSDSIEGQAAQFAEVEKTAARAAAETDNLTPKQRELIVAVASLTGEVNELSNAWARVAAQAKAAALEEARAAANTARTNAILARSSLRTDEAKRAARPSNAPAGSPVGAIGRGVRSLNNFLFPGSAARDSSEQERLRKQDEAAQLNLKAAEQNLRNVEQQRLADFKATPLPSTGGTGSKSKTRKGAKGLDPAEAARRFQDDLDRAQIEVVTAQAEGTGTLEARAEAEKTRLEIEAKIQARAIQADKSLSDAQKAQLLALNDRITAERIAAVNTQLAAENEARKVELARDDIENQLDLLDARGALATTAAEQRDIARRILDLQYQEEKARLDAVILSRDSNATEKELAQRRKDMLDELYGLKRAASDRSTQGPLEKYLDELNRSPEELRQQVEQVAVDELKALRDGINDGIASQLGIQNPILKRLLNLFLDEVLIKPLTQALSSVGGGGGGLLGGLVSAGVGLLTGRASGGHVVGGQMYRVNESKVEGFKPAGSGQIVPLGPMNAPSRGGVTLNQNVNVDARGVNPDGFAEHIRATVRQETLAIVGAGMQRVNQSAPLRLAQYQRDGT